MKEELKKISVEELKNIRDIKGREVFEAEQNIAAIDRELIRRKPFVSMADEARMNDARCFDKTKCDFWNCENESKYRAIVVIKGEYLNVFVCKEHTQIIYEPRHTLSGTMSLLDD